MKTMNFLNKCLKKKYVSVSCNTHKQKQLILSNLNELYTNFKSKYVSTSIGFLKFCGSSGTHSVCTCTYHQNMKLLLAPLNVTYQELFHFTVCNLNKRNIWFIDAQTALSQTHYCKIFCFILLEILIMMM